MELQLTTVVLATAGGVLLYAAVRDKNPVELVKLSLQGKNPNDAAAISGNLGGLGGSSAPDTTKVSTGAPAANVDSLDLANTIQDLEGKLGIDGSVVVVPYTGHPIGSHATDPDVPGFLGGIAGKNSSFNPNDPRFNVAPGVPIPAPFVFNPGAPGLGGTP